MSDDSVGASAWQRTGRKPGLQRHLSRRAGSTGGAGGDGGGERSFTVQGASNALTSGMSRKMCIKMCILCVSSCGPLGARLLSLERTRARHSACECVGQSHTRYIDNFFFALMAVRTISQGPNGLGKMHCTP